MGTTIAGSTTTITENGVRIRRGFDNFNALLSEEHNWQVDIDGVIQCKFRIFIPSRGIVIGDEFVKNEVIVQPPSTEKTEDIRLVHSEKNPKHLSFWIWSKDHYERYWLSELLELMTTEDIKKMKVVYWS